MSSSLRARHEVALSYRHSAGGAYGRFLEGLARAEIWGVRDPDGKVIVPPVDHDPETGQRLDDFILVSDQGVVQSWTWVAKPSPSHPLDQPFAFALLRLDGADTSLLHVVDVEDENAMATGMRVRADWSHRRTPSILEIRAFVPAGQDSPGQDSPGQDSPGQDSAGQRVAGTPTRGIDPAPGEPGVDVIADVKIAYSFEPGLTQSGFLRSLGEGRIEGGRCPACTSVYVPPHPRCPACRVGPMDPVRLGDEGTIVSYTIVHLPFHGMTIELPFITAWIRLDGADVPFAHLLGDVPPDGVRVGQRVGARWAPDDELAPTWESIRYFRPIGPHSEGAG